MLSTEADLDDVLGSRLSSSYYSTYQRLRARHFYRWKWHRDCEPGSLRGLRYLLYAAGVVEPRESVTVPPTQVFRSYAEEIGLPLEGFTAHAVASGRHSVDHDERMFAEPGDCLLMYEQHSGRQIAHGSGSGLTYAVDETLRNCLRSGLRLDGHDHVKAFHYGPLREMLQDLEIWSTGDFVLSLTEKDSPAARLAPFERLAAAIREQLNAQEITEIHASVTALARAHRRATRKSGEAGVFAVMLGFLLDELLARVPVPNGMGFWYTYTEAVLNALLSRLPPLRSSIASLGIDVFVLERDVSQLFADCASVRSPSFDASRPAETLRDIGFALRRSLSEDDLDCVFTAGNTIWRWLFFAEKPSGDAREVVLRWLRRPWGIVTIDDVRHAFADLLGDSEPEEGDDYVPAAFVPVVPMLQVASPQDYLCSAFGVRSHARATEVLSRFIHCRYVIHLARHQIRRVVLEPDNWRETARELIDAFAGWADSGGHLPRLDAHLDLLGDELRSGQWCWDLAESGQLSAHQLRVLKPYLDNPARSCARLFRFHEQDFVPAEHIGLMPPEKFTIRKLTKH